MFPKKPRHALLVLWLGLAALVLHALAGIAHAGSPANADGILEICTAQGIVRVDARTNEPLGIEAAAAGHQDTAGCCDLCAASCAPAVAASASPAHPRDSVAETPPAPPAERRAYRSTETLTPLVPRGPPTRS